MSPEKGKRRLGKRNYHNPRRATRESGRPTCASGLPTVCETETITGGMVPKRHTLAATVRGNGTVRGLMVPERHTLGAAVCQIGTMRGATVPKRHTLAATVCEVGTVRSHNNPPVPLSSVPRLNRLPKSIYLSSYA